MKLSLAQTHSNILQLGSEKEKWQRTSSVGKVFSGESWGFHSGRLLLPQAVRRNYTKVYGLGTLPPSLSVPKPHMHIHTQDWEYFGLLIQSSNSKGSNAEQFSPHLLAPNS